MTETAEVFGPVANDLDAVEASLRKEIESDPPEVAAPMADLFDAGGKRIRPALVLLCAMCGRYDLSRLLPAAMAVEMTHAATLVHDDVIDRSPTRRGRPTVAARLGDEPAIVIGDYYFAKAYELAARTGVPQVVDILATAVMRICSGEVRQQSIRYHYNTDIAEYMKRIEAKTATLLAACCDIGGLLGGLDDERRAALRDYGRGLGYAFQIADDVLDYTGTEGEVGKPVGQDIREGFATLPMLLAQVKLEDDRRLGEDEVRRVVEEVRRSDGPRQALQKASEIASETRVPLRKIDAPQATAALGALADYVVSRKL